MAENEQSRFSRMIQDMAPPILLNAARWAWLAARQPLAVLGAKFVLPMRSLEELWPGADTTEVTLVPRQIRRHLWAMPEHELLVLGAICRLLRPRRLLEFGTFTGGSTLVMAMNTAEDAQIVTVDIDPSSRATHRHGLGVGLLEFNPGELFQVTAYETKIIQRFADSTNFEMSELRQAVDLIFVDADHTYHAVKKDTERALEYLRPGGAILWHDYTWDARSGECAGVTRCVNEFWQVKAHCYQLAGTRFAIYLPNASARQPQ